MCTGDNAAALAGHWFRGVQRTDADGRCEFDSCFPGWYPSRAIHIHFQVRQNGNVSLTSQLYFEDALINDVLTTHPVYAERGEPRTTNAEDGLRPQENAASYTFAWARMEDGVLMVWRTLVVRSNPEDPLCAE
jgi:protocatechuate 3,4-dioxygenase beta subunit